MAEQQSPKDDQEPKELRFTTAEQPRGSVTHTISSERGMRGYEVFDTELDTISHSSNMAALFFSLSGLLLSACLGALSELLTATNLSHREELQLWTILGILAVLALVFAGLGGHQFLHKRSQIDKIRKESRPRS